MSAAWACLAVGGLAWLQHYENTPGRDEHQTSHWPVDTKIQRNDRQPTLIMFAHPQCPCTRASLEELQKIVARCQGMMTTLVVFYKPSQTTEDWDRTDLWEAAATIPGVRVVRDVDGEEARRYHASTSGQTLLYDRQGDLVFAGGLTLARGHQGDNPGRDAVESYLIRGQASHDRTPVFGCPIESSTDL